MPRAARTRHCLANLSWSRASRLNVWWRRRCKERPSRSLTFMGSSLSPRVGLLDGDLARVRHLDLRLAVVLSDLSLYLDRLAHQILRGVEAGDAGLHHDHRQDTGGL